MITYLESDVDIISNLIFEEFKIDKENSIDKRLLKYDQFGYKSLHAVVSLSDKRCELTEYQSYKNLKCEIQIRSILQHAWAEIEHDLGYKGKVSLPDNAKRSFNRLSALLETADLEFDRLKKELIHYENNVESLIKNEPQDVSINQASLISFIKNNDLEKELEKNIINSTNATLYDFKDFESIINRFDLFEIKTIQQLEFIISQNITALLKFSAEIFSNTNYSTLPNSITIFHLQHFLASKTEKIDFILKYFKYAYPEISGNKKFASRLIEIYKKSIE